MFAFGTIIDTAAIVLAGFIGSIFGHYLTPRHQDSLLMASGISVLFIGISGAMTGMLKLSTDGFSSGHSMLVVACLALGALIGEILNIELWFEKFGHWLKSLTGNKQDSDFVNGFVSATLTVCIGAMSIIGPIQDGISGNYAILATKSVLDFIIVMILTSSLGKGVAFSAIPVFVLQGAITILAKLLQPFMTVTALANITTIGSILIFCIGINLVWDKKIRVANMLPALVFAAVLAYI
ncbi:DUF554 domain-containing protein [Streptococcus didelphis]|uniref:DUF554 domain-containing protein n=1 Tax=Streptococcus didelphis TaxID=102886 RepID=A0ABY9LJK1_9STRE|nr:DUF554 domain-containing protein [Streptococcus didelphis]WMB28286.1 DUF554 domain-containing protein [Streptococcus didelphis]